MTTKRRRFAEGTTVAVEKTRSELEALLAKHGASQRATFCDDEQGRAVVQFTLGGDFRQGGRMVRMEVATKTAMPDPFSSDYRNKLDCPQGWNRWTEQQRAQWVESKQEQFEREAWRRLLLVTKAKLEIVADGASTIEREFLADIVLPDGQTVHEGLRAGLERAYLDGTMPPLLPGRT